jgi:hypothetical protein
MNYFKKQTPSRSQIDQWPVAGSGLGARVIHCLEHAGVRTVGELRDWNDKRLLCLRNFGTSSLKNVRWFLRWTERLQENDGALPNFRALLREFLDRDEIFVLEERYGLTDPLFRPRMKRRTLQEIANLRGGVTRERVRQVEEMALAALRSKLCRAAAESQEVYWANRIHAAGCVVTSGELADWAADSMLGGYQPWGVLLLMSEVFERINLRHDYFSCLPPHILNHVEKQILQLLNEAEEPVPFERILATVSDDLNFLDGQRPRLVTVMLDHHPEISGTTDRHYFLPSVGAAFVIADILRSQSQPLHFHELTRLYNERVLPHSHKGAGYILRVLNLMPDAQRVSQAMYDLKAR